MTGDTFYLGDVCKIIANDPRIVRCKSAALAYIGREGTIVGLAEDFVCGAPRHALRMPDGVELLVVEHCLRKRRPPADPAYLKFRADLLHDVGELLKLPKPVAQQALHPAIHSLLDLIGQAPLERSYGK